MTLTLKQITEKGLWQKVKELRQIAPDATPEDYEKVWKEAGIDPKSDPYFLFSAEEAEYLGLMKKCSFCIKGEYDFNEKCTNCKGTGFLGLNETTKA